METKSDTTFKSNTTIEERIDNLIYKIHLLLFYGFNPREVNYKIIFLKNINSIV